MAAWARQDTQDVKVINDDEEKENWSDDDEAHKGDEVQSYVCVWVLFEAGSDQNLWRVPPWIFWTWVLLHTPCLVFCDYTALHSHDNMGSYYTA